MSSVKLAIVYYSSTGNNYAMALAAKGAAEEAGAEVRVRKVHELAPDAAIDSNPAWRAHVDVTKGVPEVTLDDLVWADAYIFGTPTRYGNVTGQMKQFIDTTGPIWMKGQLANKIAAGFTSAMNAHGGQESTLLALYNTFHHWGSIIVTPGYTDPLLFAAGGNPYGVSATVPMGSTQPDDAVLAAVGYMAKRVVTVAGWIKKGQEG